MLIDLLFFALVVIAAIKGFQKGLIVAAFSLVAFIIGLAAAIKLSAVAAGYIGRAVKVSDQWLPVISFAVVFLVVVLVVRWGAALIEKTVQFAMLGWVNRLGGILFFTVLYITILSIAIFYAENLKVLKPETINSSSTYSFVQPWGPKVINSFGTVLPIFKNMFTELSAFFGNLSDKIRP
jgi:membrane protein required for colicin V production